MQKSQLIRVLSDSNKCPTPFSQGRQMSSEALSSFGSSSDREVIRLTRLVSQLKKENEILTIKVKQTEQNNQTLEQKIKQYESQIETYQKLPIDNLIDDNERLTQIVENQSTKIKQLLTEIDEIKDNSFQNEGKNDIIINMIQELENQKLYVQDEFRKSQLIHRENQMLYTELQLAKSQIKELNQTIEKLKMQNLESSEPCNVLHEDYLKSHEAVLNFLKKQY